MWRGWLGLGGLVCVVGVGVGEVGIEIEDGSLEKGGRGKGNGSTHGSG